MSNLTNLLVYSQLDLDFGQFVVDLWLPNLVALLTNLAVFLWLFRDRIPARYESDNASDPKPRDAWFLLSAGTLVVTLAGLIICGLLHQPISIAATAGTITLLSIGFALGKVQRSVLRDEVSWPVLAFVVGMLIVVRGLENQWLAHVSLNLPSGRTEALFTAVLASAIGSNIVNNVPMTLLAIPAIERASPGTQDVLAYGTLVGSNIGPTLTTYGSLATMLWLSLVRRRGIVISTRQYITVSLITAPAVLFTTTVALWWSTR
jgi:arsenical pump membrane protein